MAHQEDDWKSFSLTHVRYPKGDPIGFVLAFISLTPFAVFVAFVTLVIFKRELDTIVFVSGQLLNEVLNILLKNIFREPRPLKHVQAEEAIRTFGMPSQHSQFMAFFTLHCILFVLMRMQHKPFYFRYPIVLILSMTLMTVAYSRIYLLYHFWNQVVVGIFVGFSWAVIWFYIVYNFLEPRFFNAIISLPVSRFFGLTRYIPVKVKPQRKFT